MKDAIVNESSTYTEDELQTLRRDFFSYYRRLRGYLFSDTEIIYETKLTREVFDLKLQQLSQDKKQSEFENFALAAAARMVTPNIKPQTGPDGGGDGKVDGETYPVDKSISDKWWVTDGCTGNQRWAIAISVQKKWKAKVTGDVKKVVESQRGYTKLLFFTNQKIKSSTRHEEEDTLFEQYGIQVSIFDGSWFSFIVFEQGCLDLAVEKLNFSDEYRKKTVIVGPNDKKRKEELKRLEDSFISRTIVGLDTQYVDDLLSACLLSRGLGEERVKTEGLFNRAINEAKEHGTSIQVFNIIYNHAWTSFFWFCDVEAVYDDYLKLKEFTSLHPSVNNVEKLTNILTNLENAMSVFLFDEERFGKEVQFIKSFRQRDDLSQPCQLYLDIYISEHRLFQLIHSGDDLNEELKRLSSLLEQCAHYPDISFDAQVQVVDLLGRVISNNPEFELLVDRIAKISAARESEVQGALIHFNRADTLIRKEDYLPAIKHLGHCVQAFLKEGCEGEYVRACGFMGIALYHLDLPYSAEAYLVKAASVLVKEFYTTGNIPHLLLTTLTQLCEIEMMLGRLVMYLNWRELLHILRHNCQEYETKEFVQQDTLEDGVWACRFASADISQPVFEILPDIFERCDMPLSCNYLKYALGYEENVDEQYISAVGRNWQDLLLNQPVQEQFIGDLVIAGDSLTTLSSTVHGCLFTVDFKNSIKNQLAAETFLASVESLLATFDSFELVIMTPEIHVSIEETIEESSLIRREKSSEYVFYINHNTFTDERYWVCFSQFIAFFLSINSMQYDDVEKLLTERQEKEKMMDRVTSLMRLNQSVFYVLGDKFKYSIYLWKNGEDKIYPCRNKIELKGRDRERKDSFQQGIKVYLVSSNIQWWDNAKWSAVGFIYDRMNLEPPILALMFRNVEFGKKIVQEWHDNVEAGKAGVEIQIVKGVLKQHPTWYRVCIAPEMPHSDIVEGRYMGIMCRKITMTPNNSKNIDMFEKIFNHFGRCRVMALEVDMNNQMVGPIHPIEGIETKKVIITDAWRITAADSTRSALEWDDDPIIPDGEESFAPQLIKNLREVHDRKNQRDKQE